VLCFSGSYFGTSLRCAPEENDSLDNASTVYSEENRSLLQLLFVTLPQS